LSCGQGRYTFYFMARKSTQRARRDSRRRRSGRLAEGCHGSTPSRCPRGGECVFYIDSSGGSIYGRPGGPGVDKAPQAEGDLPSSWANAHRRALWLLAGCSTRLVTPFSVCLFHPMRWESEKRVTSVEAVSWRATSWNWKRTWTPCWFACWARPLRRSAPGRWRNDLSPDARWPPPGWRSNGNRLVGERLLHSRMKIEGSPIAPVLFG